MSRYRPAQIQSRQLGSQRPACTRPTRNRAGVAPHAANRSSLALAHEAEANAGHGGPSTSSQEPSGLAAGPGDQGTSSGGAVLSPNGDHPLGTGGSPSDSSARQLLSQQQQQQLLPTDEEQRADLQMMLLLPVAVCQTVTLAPQVRPSLWGMRHHVSHHSRSAGNEPTPSQPSRRSPMLTTAYLIAGTSCTCVFTSSTPPHRHAGHPGRRRRRAACRAALHLLYPLHHRLRCGPPGGPRATHLHHRPALAQWPARPQLHPHTVHCSSSTVPGGCGAVPVLQRAQVLRPRHSGRERCRGVHSGVECAGGRGGCVAVAGGAGWGLRCEHGGGAAAVPVRRPAEGPHPGRRQVGASPKGWGRAR